MASGNRDDQREREKGHKADRLAKAAQKVESTAAELRRKAEQLDALTERLANFDLWTRPAPGSRKPRFTRDEIARAALRIADAEGFDALSMRRLAAELDAGTMTLYHYVRTKDELLALVNDTVMGELIVPPDEMPTHWRAALTLIAQRSRDSIRRHPWSLDIRDEPNPGPNGARHFDQSMQAVQDLDIPLGDKFELITAVDEYVFGFCFAERANFGALDAVPGPVIAYLDTLVRSGDYPAIGAIAAEHTVTGAFDVLRRRAADPDRFGRNLARLLDGFEGSFPRP
jgi:AcrR family transcriptional regulator